MTMGMLRLGTRGFETWVRMPRIDMESGSVGWGSKTQHIKGGASIHRSRYAHREYALAWNPATRDTISTIQDFLEGAYDTPANGGIIYFVDPAAADKNMLPRLWANPALCASDAPSLTKGLRPTVAGTASNAFRLPAETATFTTTTTSPVLSVYIPIPPGMTAKWAFYGPSAQSTKIRATPYTAGVAGTPTTHGVIVNTSYGGSLNSLTGVDGVALSLNPVNGTVAITAGLLYLEPTSSALAPKSTFQSGRGHSGCIVEPGSLQKITHRIPGEGRDRESLSVRLVEVGDWQ